MTHREAYNTVIRYYANHAIELLQQQPVDDEHVRDVLLLMWKLADELSTSDDEITHQFA